MTSDEISHIELLLNNGYYYNGDPSTLRTLRELLEEVKYLTNLLNSGYRTERADTCD